MQQEQQYLRLADRCARLSIRALEAEAEGAARTWAWLMRGAESLAREPEVVVTLALGSGPPDAGRAAKLVNMALGLPSPDPWGWTVVRLALLAGTPVAFGTLRQSAADAFFRHLCQPRGLAFARGPKSPAGR
jgi:hypothetical protein